jgi:YD repeat-containing protein
VPAAVRAKQTADGRLTLFEVPLKVNTQRMVLEGGKLQPAPNQAASESSRKFAEWFTTCYDKISEEQWGTPPPESGLTQRIPVYEELRRFAFLTAVAEGLRNQGYPLPSWIRDFSIQPFPTPPTTPSTTVESGPEQGPEGFRTRKIYGGVNLAANDRDRHTEQAGPQIVELFNRIASASPTLDMTQPPVDIRVGDNWYGAKRLPVNHSPNVGANLLYENDLTVSLGETGEIGLRRVASSAVQTRGILGNAWTLDLPRLEKRRQPVSRDETVNRYATYFELTTPLNTYSEVFKEIRQVPEVNGRLMVPVRPGETLGLADSNDPQVGVQTRELLFRDGRSWHFDRETGELLAKQERGLTTIFSRDQAGRIVQIEGRSPAGKQARIQLRYDAEGRLSRAEGTDQSAASYRYEGENLVEVITPAGAVKYGYADGLVTSIVQDGKTAQEYAYGNRGELIRERGVGREETLYDYNVDETTGCVTVRRTPRGAREPLESARYDAAFRPLELKFADGARARWRYDEAGGGEATITFPQGDEYRVALSTDRRALTLTMPQGGTYALELDSSSQPALLREGSRPAVRRESRSAPGFDQITYESSTVTPEGEQAGHPPTAVFVIPAGAKGPRHDRWMRLNFDEAGRPREVKDYSGTNIQIAYDSNGSLRSTTTVRKGKPVGFQVARDSLNRITSVRSPWGEQLNQYDPATGALAAVTLTSAGQQAGLRFDDGKLISMHGFDNAEIRFAYFNEGPQNGLPREIRLPDNAVISYEYDPAGRVAAVRSAGVTNQYSYDSKGRVTAVAAVRETQ